MATNTEPKSEGNDDTRLVFSNLKFTVVAAPTTAQAYSASAATGTAIPEDPNIKGIFSASGAQMQVSAAAAPRSMDTITVEIPRSQVAMMDKRGATIVNQGVNSYSMNTMTFSNIAPNQIRDSGAYNNNLNWEVKPTYLLNPLTSGDNETETNPAAFLSSVFLALLMSSG